MQIDGTLMLYAYKFLSSDLSGARQQVGNHGYRWWSKHGTLDFPLILFEIYEFGPKARPWLPEVPSRNIVDSVWLPGAERSIYIHMYSFVSDSSSPHVLPVSVCVCGQLGGLFGFPGFNWS